MSRRTVRVCRRVGVSFLTSEARQFGQRRPIQQAGVGDENVPLPSSRDGRAMMRIMIATDAWHPQINGVMRTLTALAHSARALGAGIDFVTPEGFRSVAVPTYPGLRFALPDRQEIARRIEQARPHAIHVATEG